VRTAFGRLAGLQVAWFLLLVDLAAIAANASLFLAYLAALLPWASHGFERLAMLSALLLVPALANYVGVRSGAALSNLLTVAKLLPLLLLITLGLVRFGHHFEVLRASEVASAGVAQWLSALLLLIFVYGGFQNALVPMGEVREPRRTIPFGLFAGLAACAAVYTLVQLVTVATIGVSATERPLAEAASVLIGVGGATFVAIAVMISTYGRISAAILNTPRLACSLASQGDIPLAFGKLHPRFNTPAAAILLYTGTVWLLAASGTFIWFAELAAASSIVVHASGCAALIRLRRLKPQAAAMRLPFGGAFAVAGILISLALLTRLQARQAFLMAVTALIAIANWLWARRRALEADRAVAPATGLR
jgi:amino acid transporter